MVCSIWTPAIPSLLTVGGARAAMGEEQRGQAKSKDRGVSAGFLRILFLQRLSLYTINCSRSQDQSETFPLQKQLLRFTNTPFQGALQPRAARATEWSRRESWMEEKEQWWGLFLQFFLSFLLITVSSLVCQVFQCYVWPPSLYCL